MPNPIKASDLYIDDGAISRAIEQLGRLGKQIEEVEKVARKHQEVVKGLNTAKQKSKDILIKETSAIDRLEREHEKLTQAYSEQEKEVIRLREARKEANRQTRLEVKAAKSAKDSYNGLSAQYALNKKRLNEMSAAQRDAAEASEGLVSKTADIYKEMKRLQKETGKTSLNVGNYSEAIKEAIAGTTGLKGAMDILSKTPLLAILGLLVSAASGLFQAFKQSETGARLLERATSVLSGLFGTVIGVVDRLSTNIIAAFDDPKQAVKDLWDTIKTNIVNRFEGLIDLFKSVGDGLKALWERDIAGLEKAAKDAGVALIQLNTGLDAEQQKEFAASIRDTANAFDDLAESQRAVARQNRELTKALQSVITEEEKLRFIVDDQTLSFKARKEASEAAFEASEKRAAIELQIARNSLDVINQELALRQAQKRDVEDLKDQQVAAFVALKEAERDYTMTALENSKARRELISDEREINLDILIDLFDNQKTINERIIASDRTTFEEKRRLLKETQRLSDLSFKQQVENLQAQAEARIDINSLINESDATRLVQEVQALDLSEVNKTRLIEIIKERRLAVLDLKEAEHELSKAVNESAQAARGQVDALDIDDVVDPNDLQFDFTEVPEQKGLFDMLGLDLDDKQQQLFVDGVELAKSKLVELTQARVQAAEQAVRASQMEVDAARSSLQAAIDASEQGRAANIEARQAELAEAEKQQQEALKQRQRAQRAQLAIDTATQSSNLITAASKIFKDLPLLAAIPAIGLMFGTFAAAKIKAFQATKIFKDGGLEFLDYGGSHESGNDIYIGQDAHGSQMRAEKGEALAVINRRATTRYRSVLPSIVDSLNNQTFERNFSHMNSAAEGLPFVTTNVMDTTRMEGYLDRLTKNSETTYSLDSKGRMVRHKGNKRTTYL